MSEALLVDLGHMAYAPCAEVQREVLQAVAANRLPSTLLFVEHDPVLTLGANFHEENLLLSRQEYAARGIDVQRTDRGGDVTYHGPHQLVVYPIFDVREFGKDLHKWLRDLEETIIVTLRSLGLEGYRFPPNTGVWVRDRKVAAIGIKVSRWVSMHGIALNCDNDLSPFESIVPCGIQDYGVTSITQELGRPFTIDEAKPLVAASFEQVFGIRLKEQTIHHLTQVSPTDPKP
jgi:lipoyl(octanoyl) transferase